MKLSFQGAAQEVTGSSYLVESDGVRFLVDCGLFQGGRDAYEKNVDAFDFDPTILDFVILTHAHIDHSGLLPRLCAFGFKGPIYCTDATADLIGVMLPDSAHIQESEAEWQNRRRFRRREKESPEAAPLYTIAQALACLRQVRGVTYDAEVELHPKVRARFRDAGHILGSAIVETWITDGGATKNIVFSGDLGQPGRPILRDPTKIERGECLLVESTYGNRLHKTLEDTIEELVEAVNDTLERKKGNVIVPAFALGRTQELLFLLYDLARKKRFRQIPHVFVDSPLAMKATQITLKHGEILDAEARQWLAAQKAEHQPIRVSFTEQVEDSMKLNTIRQGAIIIAASGMCDAGRIKHHLRHNIGRRECTVLITGFQAAGTVGRKLVDREPTVTLFGEELPVRAEVYTLGGLSAHADQAALLGWLAGFKTPPKQTFVVHGEGATALGFADHLRNTLHWNARAPGRGESISL